MHVEKKLKPVAIGKKILIGVLGIAIIILVRIYYGPDTIFIFGAIVMLVSALWSLFLAIRIQNFLFIIMFLSLFLLVIANLTRVFYSVSIAEYFLFTSLLFLIMVFYLIATRKIKSREREILELAANSVNKTADGFTARPYIAGKVEFSMAEIKAFSKFILKHQIALPYTQKDRTIFLLEYSIPHYFYLRHDYSGLTHVIFSNDGDIIVNISKNSYLKYKDELTFDQLCASLGDLFVQFLELHKKDEADRIIDQMNEIKELAWV